MATTPVKSVNLLPEFLRTDKNSKFLASTIDQLIQSPQLERIDGYVGSKLSPNYDSTTDFYIQESLRLRQDYQLEPALIVKNDVGVVKDCIGIDDLANDITTNGGQSNNFDRLFKSEFYSYNPHIDWDKLINYQEYYWLTNGPQTIEITGQQRNSTSTFTVLDNEFGSSFIFNPDGLTEDPLIILYRGNTYNFEINSEHNFYIKTSPTIGSSDQYNIGVTNNGISSGTVTIVVTEFTSPTLFYVSGDEIQAQGQFSIQSIDQDTTLNVESVILGKKSYTDGNGVTLSNGMKVKFGGLVYPEFYKNKEFFIEGVGTSINLIDYELLVTSKNLSNLYNDNFDVTPFDNFPFDNFKSLPIVPEYITINRASRDLNSWSMYNRWVHQDVIRASAIANNQEPLYFNENRATRPIVEFNADLQLYNFGSVGIKNVDLIDNDTADAFSTVEGSAGYYVDGVLLEQGHRVIFNADSDSLVRGKIYQVNYIIINDKLRLELQEPIDHTPPNFASISINLGTKFKGSSWGYNGDVWQFSQQHTKLNQFPLFDLFDKHGASYSLQYTTDFKGNSIFGYDIGTGNADPVLGFPLSYENSTSVGRFLFKNYFATESIAISENDQVVRVVPTKNAYYKFSKESTSTFANTWALPVEHKIPIIQFQTISASTSTLAITTINNTGSIELTVDVFVNTIKVNKNDFTVIARSSPIGTAWFIEFNKMLELNSNVLLKIYTNVAPNSTGFYETPIGLTNNPLNTSISKFTLSELSDHLYTITNKVPGFIGNFPGISNLRDIPEIGSYGTRLISNSTPLSFSQFFIGKKEHSVITALSNSKDQYAQFKLSLLKKITELGDQLDSISALDIAITALNKDKSIAASYYLSDMIAYGSDKTVREWTVTDSRNTVYPIISNFNLDSLSLRSVLVYLNDQQLLANIDYEFISNDSSIKILVDLVKGDKIVVNDYFNTAGSYVPPTPTKLGLYPAFAPSIYYDNTYSSSSVKVIQGHDGSILVAYNDFRDNIILEFEKRVFNNIKSKYRAELFDINSAIPGAFRNVSYSKEEINDILRRDYIKWAGLYGIDITTNTSFNQNDPFTWNYSGSYDLLLTQPLTGSWRSIFKHFYDTDRPHTHPWEMLGMSQKPTWWEEEYGPAPYTAGNAILWTDIEKGIIKAGTTAGIYSAYARPGLSQILPVDEFGNLLTPLDHLVTGTFRQNQNWNFGDCSPAETAWRRSSSWPFTVQILLALTNPAKYSSLMYDPIRINKNIVGQWVYGDSDSFLTLKNILIHNNNNQLTSGYSVYVSEIGKQRTTNYINELTQDLLNLDINLFYKVGGFVSKDKLQIIIDAYDPTSESPGAILPQEDYNLILNVSNPIKRIGISGIVIQKVEDKFLVKGYDKFNPYFNIYKSIRNSNTQAITVGGISEPYAIWSNSTIGGNSQLSSIATTTANAAITSRFYQKGQIVFYGNKFYRVSVSHTAEGSFDSSLYQVIPSLPVKGGATVQLANRFDSSVTQVPYSTEYTKIQDVYDLIIGYGKWLEDQGFIFDQYNNDLGNVIDWNFSGKEFLYWTTQNWADNNVITLSPFADKITYKSTNSVVDNVFDTFYEYSILQANGIPLPAKNLAVNRQDGLCTISTINDTSGIYFAQINSVQKEHAMVFNNNTVFNDTIYDPATGYRQLRMKLVGFRTKNWDGDYFSPGFIYDTADTTNWKEYTDYRSGSVVRYTGNYYSANTNVIGSLTFNFTNWTRLIEKPVAELLPNFDYKINQFEDFYSLDIDNFDSSQQRMAQHLIGYTPRTYLNNIFTNPIAQYKFYQGYIREKGTRNSITNLAKASIFNLQGELNFTEEWAFRIGQYGAYETYKEIEFPLIEGTFIENPQIINFVNNKLDFPNDLIHYTLPSELAITPLDYSPDLTFSVDSSTYLENNFQLSTAGYVRFDDVTATAYNENSLLDIANNRNITEGDVIWLGFKKTGNWDVLRYTKSSARVIGVFVSLPLSEITFVTDSFHNLAVGDIISISQFNSQVNGVYIVVSIPKLTQFAVSSTLSSIVNDELLSPGLLFKFTSSRFNTFDTISSDQELIKFPTDSIVWVDEDDTGKWKVYQKAKQYSKVKTVNGPPSPQEQNFGWRIRKAQTSDILVVSAPTLYADDTYGKIFVFRQLANSKTTQLQFTYALNDLTNYCTDNTITEFGYSLVYDEQEYNESGYGIIFAGAPLTSNVISTGTVGGVIYSANGGVSSAFVQQGLVKISSIDKILIEDVTKFVLVSPYPSSYEQFGSSMFVEKNASSKLLLVGAPGTLSTGTGSVYAFRVDASTSTVNISAHLTGIELNFYGTLQVGSQWGYAISGSDNADTVAVSAPNYSTGTGIVQVFSNTVYSVTINSPFGQGDRFGETVALSADGKYLFISAVNARNADQSYGKVAVYKKNTTGVFGTSPIQVISNPAANVGMKLGYAIELDATGTVAIISALGTNRSVITTFDNYYLPLAGPVSYINDPESIKKDAATTYDSNTTRFFDNIEKSGTVYSYNRKFDRFVFSEELNLPSVVFGTNYGNSLALDRTSVYVGAPAVDNTSLVGTWYQFDKIDPNVNGWRILREQSDLVNLEVMQRALILNSYDEEVVEYLDIIDPLKGKIAGLANQELRYKSAFDPAIYSIGVSGTVNNTDINWLDEHLGELWWDLSTVKYVWYEQGDLSYRKNNWGQLFPGATIDVYEWIGSEYLPSEWSTAADTSIGLTKGISGQPKYADNSVISVKQIYSSVTNSFSNMYYYWVKNKVTLPDVKNRRISSYQVASLIADPTAYGLKFVELLSNNAVAIANVGPILIDNRLHLNISSDIIDNKIPKHTEWLLLQEGSTYSVPNKLLEKKLIDSLLGHDSLGNIVPNPALTARERYGIGIRPQQTLFKNRLEALRNLTDFTNDILARTQITSNYSFINLEKAEEISDLEEADYDQIVENNEGLTLVDVARFIQAQVSCTVKDGRIRSITINNPGFGYKIAPSIKIISDIASDAYIITEIDSFGKVINAIIKNVGAGYTTAPVLEVRTFTVIVQSDDLLNGKWSKFAYDVASRTWIRAHTQKYNTSLYWDYIDWQSSDYNKFIDYTYTIDGTYELETLTSISSGQYVKVKNGGDGRYIILEKLSDGSTGTFSNEYNIVYSENGTIQLKNLIWDYTNSNYGFDQVGSYDQTLFDQTPDIELEYILTALKNDIFVGDLKIYWNLFFFTAVKYALSEQKLLDWAFKTSFINVKNNAGELDQRPVYKLRDSSYYEDYLREVKPYHTNIRSFSTEYSVVDPSRSYTTDFDFPTVYNKETDKFESITFDNPLIDEYPWKSWVDNSDYGVGNITIGKPGSGYILPPTILIQAAPGDSGSGATAKAYISSGKITGVNIINQGSGYRVEPTVLIIGGGDSMLTAAVLYAQLTNNKVRSNKIGIRFDRTSKDTRFISNTVTDQFICNGSTTEFLLNWLSNPDKATIVVKLDGTLVLGSDYTVIYYDADYQDYVKKYNKLVFLNYVPSSTQVLEVTYVKNIQLLNATTRILNYYTATNSMPGLDLPQLMTGIEYPKTIIEGLSFNYTTKWDVEYSNFDESPWADDVGGYTAINVVSTATVGTSTVVLTTTTGIIIGQLANISSYITNKFSTSSDILVTLINSATNSVSFNSTLSSSIYPNDTIEFWNYDSNSNVLDSAIEAGSWSTLTSNYYIGALGVQPEDIIIDGDAFLNSNSSHGPEELVPGHVIDSVGINVYTKNSEGAPIIFSNSISIIKDTTTTYPLSITPPNKDSITVSFNGVIFSYSASADFSSQSQFAINWETNEIIIPPQDAGGMLGYTIISIGGGIPNAEAGVVDNAIITVNSTSTVQLRSLSSFGSINSAYVTVDGVSISQITTTTNYGYILTYANEGNNRAAVEVYNLSSGVHTVQAWFFTNLYKDFNEVREQLIPVTETPETTFELLYPPGNIQPAVAHTLVEINENGARRRLLPPYISYYEVSNSIITTFEIDNRISRPPGTFGLANVEAYVNGFRLRPGFDFSVASNNTITINPALLAINDVIAIVGLPIGGDHEYNIIGNTLILTNAMFNIEIRVITYTDHDDMLMRTERFNGIPNKRYKISRPVLNDNYVWVQVNGIPLTSKLDYEVLDDQITIQVSDAFEHTSSDDIVITSISSAKLAGTVLGYRIFNDIFDRTHFKRLSKKDTTYLTRPLNFFDTEIHVDDAIALTPPIISKKKPGVIIIDGERIEFFRITGNVLSQLRRSTLGTAPSFYSQENTKVIDQSAVQTIPFSESILTQTITTINTNTYIISNAANSSAKIDLNQQPLKISLFGDSIMCGRDPSVIATVGVCRNGDLVSARTLNPPDTLLYNALSDFDVEVTTRSSGGSSSGDLLAGTDDVNGPWPDDIDASIVVINHGINDVRLAVSTSTYKENLITLRNGLTVNQVVVWQTPTPVAESFGWDVNLYAQIMREVAAIYNDVVADANSIPNWLAYLSDGIHPIQEGYDLLVSTKTAPAIRQAISRLISVGNGITLSTATNINAVDQIAVYYGGRLLKKVGTYYHDSSISYDSPPANILGTTSTSALLPTTFTINDAYVVKDTNRVWIYTNSNEVNAVNGYVYSGLQYLEPEFSVTTSTQSLTLNIQSGVQSNIKLTVVKKEFARNTVWNTEISNNQTLSLLDSTTLPARFLQQSPAELPDKYYYGGDPSLTTNSGLSLTDEYGNQLEEGY